MCGIAGIYSLDDRCSRETLAAVAQRVGDSLAHRGPDDEGVYLSLDGRLALANQRLAVIDLSSDGHQPMVDESGRYWITFNGEIYNYQALRADLAREGYPFRSSTDTEAILALYARHGRERLDQLRGMFAFGLWDSSERRLVLARDPLGIKPLYCYTTGNSVLFASELRALLASGMVPRRLSLEGLTSYLEYGSVQAPLTIIEGVRLLPAGHYVVIEPRDDILQAEEVPYAEGLFLEDSTPLISDRREAAACLHQLLRESVGLHLVSDVPLGVFLSGGIDSSALVALMSQVSGERPKTFTVVFNEPEYSEAPHARLVADEFATEHQEIPLTDGELVNMLPEALRAMDQPTIDGINTFVISKAVKEAGITVALSGLGGDELFAGYPSFRRARKLEMLARIPQPFRRGASVVGRAVYNDSVQQSKFWELFGSDGSPATAYTISRHLFVIDEIRNLLCEMPSQMALTTYGDYRDVINAVSRYELQGYMANTLLRDTDCMSMAHALEVRVPFVDPLVVHYVLGLPGEWKLDRHLPKPLLLDSINGLLPEEIWRRPKMGFTLPFERWLHSTLKDEMERVLVADTSHLERIGVRSQRPPQIWQGWQKAPNKVGWSRPWAIYVLVRWCELNDVWLKH